MRRECADREPEAIRELAYYAVAHVVGRNYPTLLTRKRSLRRAFCAKVGDPTWRDRLLEVLGDILPEARLGENPALSLDEWIAQMSAHILQRPPFLLRVYVATVKAFNYCTTSILSGWDWLGPWDPWHWYVRAPIDESDEEFVLSVAGTFDCPPDAVAARVLDDRENGTVLQTLIWLRDASLRALEHSEAIAEEPMAWDRRVETSQGPLNIGRDLHKLVTGLKEYLL